MTTKRLRLLLWLTAFILTLGSAAWQRLSGPTWPRRGAFEVDGARYRYRLPRSAITGRDARVAIPVPGDPGSGGSGTRGELMVRRFPTDEPLTALPLRREGDLMVGLLPAQPAAGKLAYHLVLRLGGRDIRVPEDPARDPIVRFRGSVPALIMVPHILFMFLAILFALLAGLEVLFRPERMGRSVLAAFGTLTLGGMVLGPLVQKAAFGEYWTGFPFGYDLTDNKTLLMWLAWLGAILALRFVAPGRERVRRGAVLAAAVLTIVVYLIPHSAFGSELDWKKQAGPATGAAPASGDRVHEATRFR